METRIHIGSMIKQYLDEKNIVRTAVAAAMNTPNTAIYAYEKRDSLKTSTVIRICNAVKYNFFMDIANAMPPDFKYNQTSLKDDLIKQQAAEIQKLQLENTLLKELILGRK